MKWNAYVKIIVTKYKIQIYKMMVEGMKTKT